MATFDSSGPDAWDVKAHPLVYFSSEGTESASPKYDEDAPFFAGFHIVDANTREVVASALFNVGQEITSFPHGVDTSPDGKWAYVGWGQKYVSMGAPWIREEEGFRAAIAKVNLEDGSVTVIPGVGSHPGHEVSVCSLSESRVHRGCHVGMTFSP